MKMVSRFCAFFRVLPYQSWGKVFCVTVLASGCASITPPAGSITDSTRKELQKSFDGSLPVINASIARGTLAADPAVAQTFLGSGMALADMQCKSYFKNLGLAAQKYSYGRKQLGLTGGVVAGLQGITGVSAKIISVTASMFSFGTASAETYADAFLFSPDISGVQELVEAAQTAFRGVVPATTRMTYADAANLLAGYDKLCEVHTIRRLINESITSAKPVANPDRQVADREQFVTSAERYLLAREVGEPTLSSDQVAYIYWLTFGAPSETDLPIIRRGLQDVPLFVAADGTLKPLAAADLLKVKRALASLIDRNEAQLKNAIAVLRAAAADKSVPGTGTEESSPGRSTGSVFPSRTGGSISIKVR